MNNPTYKLPINAKSCYLLELYPGCEYCTAAPGIVIRKIGRKHYMWEEAEDSPELSLVGVDGFEEAAIKCGLDPDEFKRAAVKEMAGPDVDEDLAEILAEDLWGSVLRRFPEIVEYKR